jgi:hypothetical protein
MPARQHALPPSGMVCVRARVRDVVFAHVVGLSPMLAWARNALELAHTADLLYFSSAQPTSGPLCSRTLACAASRQHWAHAPRPLTADTACPGPPHPRTCESLPWPSPHGEPLPAAFNCNTFRTAHDGHVTAGLVPVRNGYQREECPRVIAGRQSVVCVCVISIRRLTPSTEPAWRRLMPRRR